MSQQKEIGTLVVVVLKAQHLHQPSFYKQNPYAQATLSGLKRRTKTAPKGGQHPVWDDELRFPVLADTGKDKANRILDITCYKDEQRGEDVLLGKGTVDIEETLKTGEFDDWVPLETESAGARGEVYLEMTFYANSLPPLTRRPSKLSPSDRLARPEQGQQSIQKISGPIASAYAGRSPIIAEGKTSPTSGSQIPASLIPARGGKSQASKQVPPNGGASPAATTVKHKDAALPPLPASDTLDVGSGRNTELPTALHPGGRGGPRSMAQQNQNRVTSMGRPPPEILPEPLHRRTLSDTLTLHVPSPFPSSATTAVAGASVGSTPSILVAEHLPALQFPTPLISPPGTYLSMQPNSQILVPAATQGYSRTLSPFQPPMPPRSPYMPLEQPQQHYDASPPSLLPSHHQQHTQYTSRPMTPQTLPQTQTYPQHQGAQPQQQPLPQQQPPYSPQPQLHPPYGLLSQQQQYLSQPQQQYEPQHLPYPQSPHPQTPQPYQQHPLSKSAVAPQQPVYSQPQPQQSFVPVPPPPPIQSQTQTPNAYTRTPHRPQPYFSPPPPPPPLYNQGGNGPSIPSSVAQPLQASVPLPPPSQGPTPPSTSSQQKVSPVAPLLQPPAAPLSSQVVSDAAPAVRMEEVVGQSRVKERPNEAGPIAFAETTAAVREMREPLGRNQTNGVQSRDVIVEEQGQVDAFKDVETQGVREERDSAQRTGEERQNEGDPERLGETKRPEEECIRQQEEEQKRHEQEECEKEEEARKEKERSTREEERWREELKNEEERRKQELSREEEHRKREEELRGKEEELRRKEEELMRREEEERRRREEEGRKRREEEHRRQEEEERRRQVEEERKTREEECRRREEEERRRQREEVERRQKEAEAHRRRTEEAAAERRWQEELARLKARAEQEAADAAFARAQMDAEEAERRRQEEADLALVRQAQEEEEREERRAQERRQQEEADREVARREQAHEEELERRREEGRRKRMEKADRELARKLDMELNLST